MPWIKNWVLQIGGNYNFWEIKIIFFKIGSNISSEKNWNSLFFKKVQFLFHYICIETFGYSIKIVFKNDLLDQQIFKRQFYETYLTKFGTTHFRKIVIKYDLLGLYRLKKSSFMILSALERPLFHQVLRKKFFCTWFVKLHLSKAFSWSFQNFKT